MLTRSSSIVLASLRSIAGVARIDRRGSGKRQRQINNILPDAHFTSACNCHTVVEVVPEPDPPPPRRRPIHRRGRGTGVQTHHSAPVFRLWFSPTLPPPGQGLFNFHRANRCILEPDDIQFHLERLNLIISPFSTKAIGPPSIASGEYDR